MPNNKAVLLSIRPEWCDLIVRGKKTMEVRKNYPKHLYGKGKPFKVYIYCTKAPQQLITIFKDREETMDGEIHHGKPVFVKFDKLLPDSVRVNVRCMYYMKTARRVDLANLIEATTDILVKARVLEDDNSKIVAAHDGSRVEFDRKQPRVEIEIKEMEE